MNKQTNVDLNSLPTSLLCAGVRAAEAVLQRVSGAHVSNIRGNHNFTTLVNQHVDLNI